MHSETTEFSWPWETLEGRICIVGYVLAVVFGLTLPDDVQNQWPLVQSFTEFVASWNSQVKTIGAMKTEGAKAIQFFYAVLWCAMPLYWAMLVRHSYPTLKSRNFIFTFESGFQLLIVIGGLLLLNFALLNPTGDINGRFGHFLFGLKLSRSLVAPMLVFSTGMMVACMLVFMFAWAFGRVRYEKKGR